LTFNQEPFCSHVTTKRGLPLCAPVDLDPV
jgi:hypothetical protein